MIAGLTASRYCRRWRVPLSSFAIALRSDSNASRSLILWRSAASSSTSCFLVFLSSSVEAIAAAAPGAGTSCLGLPVRLSASYIANPSSQGGLPTAGYAALERVQLGRGRRGAYSAQFNTNPRSSDNPFTAIVYLRLRQLSPVLIVILA